MTSTEREITPEARIAVAAAFAAEPDGTPAQIAGAALRAAGLMNGRIAQAAQDVLDCDVFKADYLGYTLEESSTRLKVRLRSETTAKADAGDDGTEEIRTERTDNMFGQLMRDRLDGLRPGSTILVFKLIEHMDGRGMKDKVRIMKHFEILKHAGAGAPLGAPPPATGAGTARPAPVASPTIRERLDQLSREDRVEIGKRARAEGITDAATTDPDQITRLHEIIDTVEGWR